jgi:predicted O-methyltransferase YrrM
VSHELDLSGVESSYSINAYGPLFYALARTLRPASAVELGTFKGYSALHIAAGMRDGGRSGASLVLVDLWSDYPYRHCARSEVEERLRRNGLLDVPGMSVELRQSDVHSCADDHGDESVDLLHVDVSHDADALRAVLERWTGKVRRDGVLLLEGGSAERDRVPWMLAYRKVPIEDLLRGDWFRERFDAVVLPPFPSLTIARRRS